MTTLDTTNTITSLLDELTHALADVPGRTPQDAQIGANLLAYVMSDLQKGQPSRLLLNTLERHGCDPREAVVVAERLTVVALRLGAWLGRVER